MLQSEMPDAFAVTDNYRRTFDDPNLQAVADSSVISTCIQLHARLFVVYSRVLDSDYVYEACITATGLNRLIVM
jgi:hypothetical protein